MIELNTLLRDFLLAGGNLATKIVDESAEADADLMAAVRTAVEHGEHLTITLHLGNEPKVELASQNDYDERRRIATIAMPSAPPHGGH